MSQSHKSLTFTTAKIPLPAGINPESIAQSDAAFAELQACQKRGLQSAKRCGELWANLHDSTSQKVSLIHWLGVRYEFSQRTIYTYIDVHKKWNEKVKKAKELGIKWEPMSINDFLAIGKEAKPEKEKAPKTLLDKVKEGIEEIDEQLKRLTNSQFREQVEAFFAKVGGKKNIKHVTPGTDVTVKVGDSPILLMPSSPTWMSDSHLRPDDPLAKPQPKIVPISEANDVPDKKRVKALPVAV